MYDDGYSDTTTDSSPATVRRKIDKPSIITTTTTPGESSSGNTSMRKLSSKDFLPPEIRMEKGKEGESETKKPGSTSSTKGRPPSAPKQGSSSQKEKKPSHDEVEDEDEDDEEYDELNAANIEGIYNPEDYKNLAVTPEIKELFAYIAQFQLPPLNSVNDVKLHPFIPDYYPSVGDIDAFIKVVEPEIKEDGLGVKVLDEPAPFQSDPSVLDLRLRALAKQSSAKTAMVKKVDNLGKNTKVIEKWIKDISDLHRSKPSPSVHYSKPMPDIDLLLQEWSPEVEELMQDIQLPGPDLNCDLATYADIVCTLLDIPVYKSRVQSLHVLFTLFATMKQFSNQFNHGGLKQEDFMAVSNSLRILEEEGEIVDGVNRLHVS